MTMLRSLRQSALLVAVAFAFLSSYVPALAEGQFSFEQAAYDQSGDQPGLWYVQGEGGPVWIFGTIHLLPSGFSWRTESVNQALSTTDVIVLEAPVGGEHAQRTVAAIRRYAQVHPNKSIRALVPDFQQPRAEMISARFGIPWARIQDLPPWLGGIMLAQSLYASLGFSPESGIEQALVSDPTLHGKRWQFFETPEEQLGFFAKQPAKVQVDMFLSTLSQMEEGGNLVSEMFAAWATGDIDQMDQLFNKNMKQQSPKLYKTLVADRNKNWVPRIEVMLRDPKTYFVAVGAGHLGGPTGVIALLEKRGYEVKTQ